MRGCGHGESLHDKRLEFGLLTVRQIEVVSTPGSHLKCQGHKRCHTLGWRAKVMLSADEIEPVGDVL